MAKKKPVPDPKLPKHPEDFTFSGYVPIERINLQIAQIRSQFGIDLMGLRDSAELECWREEITHQMVMQLKAKCASKKFEFQTTAYPSDWWQAFKKRWFPSWALKRWPIQVTEVTAEALAYYPDIQIPDHAAYVSLSSKVRRRYLEGLTL